VILEIAHKAYCTKPAQFYRAAVPAAKGLAKTTKGQTKKPRAQRVKGPEEKRLWSRRRRKSRRATVAAAAREGSRIQAAARVKRAAGSVAVRAARAKAAANPAAAKPAGREAEQHSIIL
jgi:hypothetical protein